ncbi:MAG: hypothetical protein JSR97_12345 [Verrucomicrobia bacterium]|nr:hypothetical protein [Verrucomicrobiota bacterium]
MFNKPDYCKIAEEHIFNKYGVRVKFAFFNRNDNETSFKIQEQQKFASSLVNAMGYTFEEITERNRATDVVIVRQIAMCYTKRKSRITDKLVGRIFKRDRSDVVHAKKTVLANLHNPKYAGKIALLATKFPTIKF